MHHDGPFPVAKVTVVLIKHVGIGVAGMHFQLAVARYLAPSGSCPEGVVLLVVRHTCVFLVIYIQQGNAAIRAGIPGRYVPCSVAPAGKVKVLQNMKIHERPVFIALNGIFVPAHIALVIVKEMFFSIVYVFVIISGRCNIESGRGAPCWFFDGEAQELIKSQEAPCSLDETE